jgi:hypothetical protein
VSATLEIRETPEGLTLQVQEGRKIGAIFWTLVSALLLGFILVHRSDSLVIRLIVGALVAYSLIRDLISYLHGTNVVLRATNLDFVSTGRAPDGYSPSSIPRASIYSLEFREAQGGGDDPAHPSGLYIEHQGVLYDPTVCVLPHIDESQTRQAIEAILRRYPDTEDLAPPKKGNASDLITLDLNK